MLSVDRGHPSRGRPAVVMRWSYLDTYTTHRVHMHTTLLTAKTVAEAEMFVLLHGGPDADPLRLLAESAVARHPSPLVHSHLGVHYEP